MLAQSEKKAAGWSALLGLVRKQKQQAQTAPTTAKNLSNWRLLRGLFYLGVSIACRYIAPVAVIGGSAYWFLKQTNVGTVANKVAHTNVPFIGAEALQTTVALVAIVGGTAALLYNCRSKTPTPAKNAPAVTR